MPLKKREKKEYSEQAKKTAARYGFANLCLNILLLVVIVQCVWMARMGVNSFTLAKQHIFLMLPAYQKMVHFFFMKPKLVHLLSPYVWPYVPYIIVILLANFFFSYRASRALKRGRVAGGAGS